MSAVPAELDAEIRLLDLLLEEQRSLTPVERFPERHAAADGPLQERYYRDLLPSTAPGPGEQYAFRVDLDQCTGCKACVTACQSLNGLDAHETWRDVGLLLGEAAGEPVQQTVTTTCHHCEDPACLNGCPARAYEKDPETGIVRHLDDQCIGCQYCILKCPYDVPQYDASRGIVRKCDMCTGRLSAGEAPACVQGCPNQAISISLVTEGRDRQAAWMPVLTGAIPASSITRPTTQYVSGRLKQPTLFPANQSIANANDAHTPLALMMVAVQLSVGLLIVDRLTGSLVGAEVSGLRNAWSVAAASIAVLGQAGAFLHLGRPLYAFRAVLGWRTSWMSREILALGAFVGLTIAYAASWVATPTLESTLALDGTTQWIPALRNSLGSLAVSFGLLSTHCSVMIYVDTRRPFWSIGTTSLRFFGSIVVLGPVTALALGLAVGELQYTSLAISLSIVSVAAVALKLVLELSINRYRGSIEHDALARSAELIVGPLRKVSALRCGAAIVATASLVLLLCIPRGASHSAGPLLATASFVSFVVGESLERHLFFRAEAARAMPGL